MLKALGFATSPLNSSECIPAKTGTGASIDTAEYVTLKDALIQTGVNSSLSGHVNDVAAHLAADDVFAAHINAEMSSYGQQQYQAGRDSGLATVSNAYEIVVEEARKQNERAEKAEVALTSQAIEVEKMLCDALGQKWSAAGISVESLIAALAGRAAVADGAPPDIDASTVPLSQARRKIARLQAELAAKAVSPFSGNPAHTMARERAKGEFKTLRADWGSCSICAGTKTTFGKRCVCTQTEMEQ
jgi:hypothetical protein